MSLNKFYVYCFYNCDWNEPFYIGKGSGNRYKNMSKRSNHIKAIFQKYQCESRILIDDLTEEESYILEKELKKSLKNDGKPIIDGENEVRKFNQQVGIENAKKQGKYKGRKHKVIPNFDAYYRRYINREISKSDLARELNISRPTLNKYISQHEISINEVN